MTIDLRLGLLANARPPIDVTLLGIAIDEILVPSNEASPIEVTLLGKVTDTRDSAARNSPSLIAVIPEGIVTEVSPVFLNALLPIEVTVLGIDIDVRAEAP
jgi:hypothetical protein